MKDAQILDLYWERQEQAIYETQKAYGNYCYSIAWNILYSREDSDECVNDTWLRAWNAIPPKRPNRLALFLGTITRNLSLDRWKERHAMKRGKGEMELALDELAECLPDAHNTEAEAEAAELAQRINDFVLSLSPMDRRVFICRYWYLDPISDIAKRFGFSQSKVKMMLHRQRKNLLKRLKREEFLE